MAREIWLRKNWRPFAFLAIVPAGILVVSAGILASVGSASSLPVPGALMVIAALWVGWTLRQAISPRLSYRDGVLEVFLGRGSPARVPIQIVECFFLGQGASLLPKMGTSEGENSSPETATLIVRLSESALDWKHRDVRAVLGQWCEGYITIRGTFSEPLTPDLALRLNRKLVEAHRSIARERPTTAPRLPVESIAEKDQSVGP